MPEYAGSVTIKSTDASGIPRRKSMQSSVRISNVPNAGPDDTSGPPAERAIIARTTVRSSRQLYQRDCRDEWRLHCRPDVSRIRAAAQRPRGVPASQSVVGRQRSHVSGVDRHRVVAGSPHPRSRLRPQPTPRRRPLVRAGFHSVRRRPRHRCACNQQSDRASRCCVRRGVAISLGIVRRRCVGLGPRASRPSRPCLLRGAPGAPHRAAASSSSPRMRGTTTPG